MGRTDLAALKRKEEVERWPTASRSGKEEAATYDTLDSRQLSKRFWVISLLRRGDMERTSSGGYSRSGPSIGWSRGMIIVPLDMRLTSVGRLSRPGVWGFLNSCESTPADDVSWENSAERDAGGDMVARDGRFSSGTVEDDPCDELNVSSGAVIF